MPLEGRAVFVGPNKIPAILIRDNGEKVQVRILGEGGVLWLDSRLIRMAELEGEG